MASSCALSWSAALPRGAASFSGQESASFSGRSDQPKLGSTFVGKQLPKCPVVKQPTRNTAKVTALLGGNLSPQTLADISQSIGSLGTTLGITLRDVLGQPGHLPEVVAAQIATLLSQLPPGVTSKVGSALSQLPTENVQQVFSDLSVAVGAYNTISPESWALAGSTAAVAVTARSLRSPKKVADSLPLRYDPAAITKYFEKRPVEVASRTAFVLARCSQLVSAVLIDRRTGKELQNEKLRAKQLRQLITDLGPTAIKVGQALSIRPDLLSLAYLEELQTLQDRVPAFSTEEAKMLIEEGLGRPLGAVFSEFSSEPVAAASLGQVYKARLASTNSQVAVKVQRPGVLEGICLDLYLLRIGAQALERMPNIHSDLVAVLDNWANRFFDELDYVQEGQNAIRFAHDMKDLSNVIVAEVYPEHTSRKVLTTAWIEGEKLSESTAGDVGPLVTTMLNCYLIQLLESGFLHADPHPGNLLRTPDGKLCVLDFGLMTEVTEDQRYALIEYISHLVNSDYEKVAEDLVVLGFVPPELVDPEKTKAVVPQLSRVLGELVKGGGARKVNVNQVTADLAALADDYVFVIPPYFALILRAFGVLEGIGLAADPNYAIVDECYPYLSKRLLTDDHPRTRNALKYFLYGRGEQINVERIEELAAGFSTFRDLMRPVGLQTTAREKKQTQNRLDPTTQQALSVIFSQNGSFLQDLLLNELVKTVDALSRDALATFWRLFGFPASLPVALLTQRNVSPPVPGSWPIPLPGMIFSNYLPTAKLSEEDEKALDTVKRLWRMVEPQLRDPNSARDAVGLARDLFPLMQSLAPGVSSVARRFVILLLQRQAQRLADDLENAARYTGPIIDTTSRPITDTTSRPVTDITSRPSRRFY